jgi:hypothetical protein
MKTPREVLFERHQAVETKLDAIREQVVAGVAQTAKSAASRVSKPARRGVGLPTWKSAIRQVGKPALRSDGTSALEAGWRQFLWSLRWHLAGLSAVWLVVLALSIDQSAAPTREVARQDAPSSRQLVSRQLVTALRENQRQLRELIRAPAAEAAPEPRQPAPSPRSQVQPFSMALT